MLLAEVALCSERVAETSARLQKVGLLADCLRRLAAEEVPVVVGMLSGAMRQGRIGIGYAAAMKSPRPAPATAPTLSVLEVDATLSRIQTTSGTGATRRRLELLHGMLARATEAEQRFLVRLVVGELRQGALEGVLVEAVARAADVSAAAVRRALMLHGELTEVAVRALGGGAEALAALSVQLFRPLQPMLAQPCDSVSEALDKLDGAVLEHKIDGARIQVHKEGDRVAIYTRHLKEVTAAAPEVVQLVAGLPVQTAILDGEVVALDAGGTPHPFQTTMRRFGRKLDVARMAEELPLSALFFDCLLLDGESLIDRPGNERYEAMPSFLPAASLIPRVQAEGEAHAAAFLDEALARGHEGIMAKAASAPYAAGRRGADWLKIKPAHTLDLVVLAADWGHGRRTGWLSNLHLGARDPRDGSFVMLGKTFKGMTDDMLRWQTEKLQELAVAREAYTVHVRPELVVEILANDIQTSPHYPGGLALRFARVKRYRTDKRPEEADTIDTVRAMHAAGAAHKRR